MALNSNPSHLDEVQIAQRAFEAADDSVRTTIVGGAITLTEQAVAAPGDPAPAEVKVAGGVDGTSTTRALHTDTSGDLQIDVLTSALPTGAATEATLAALNAKTAGALVPTAFDEVVITYVGATTDTNTVVYKLASSTVATLSFSYDGSNRLSGVVKT